jgi:acyl-CoA thioesterase
MRLPRVTGDGPAYEAIIEDIWLQGRTAYGGASAAVALTAIKAAFPELPPLRSAQVAFIGPLAGEVTATPVLLRRGKNSAFIGCDVSGSDGIGIRTLFLFMASRDSTIAHLDLPMPDAGHPEDALVDPSKLPQGFLTNFDLSHWGNEPAGFVRWCRLRARDGLDPEIELIAIADALPPAAMALAKAWGPISTTTWQLNLVTDAPRTRDGWWLLRADTQQAGKGASSQKMTIWNRDGEPIATALQSVALFV